MNAKTKAERNDRVNRNTGMKVRSSVKAGLTDDGLILFRRPR
jgi:hypothetical protein